MLLWLQTRCGFQAQSIKPAVSAHFEMNTSVLWNMTTPYKDNMIIVWHSGIIFDNYSNRNNWVTKLSRLMIFSTLYVI
jgi:hypothetical protein